MPRVNIPGVGVVHFPDDMSEEEIVAAIEQISAPAEPTSALENVGQFGSNIVRGLRERVSAIASLPGQAYQDPLGTAGNVLKGMVAAPFTGISRLAKGAMRDQGVAQEYFDDPVQAVEDVASVIPAVGGLVRSGRALAAPSGRRLYQSALKPSTALSPEKRTGVIETGLREGINPASQRGYDKLQGTLSSVGGQIGKTIDDAQARGVTGRVDPIVQAAEGEIRKAANVPEVDPSMPGLLRARLREVETGPTFSYDLPGLGRLPRQNVPIDKLQGFKQGLDERVQRMGGAFGEHSTSPQVRLEKEMGDATRKQIAELVPELEPLNQRYGPLKDLSREMERNIGREGNRDVLSPGRALVGAAMAGGGPASRMMGAGLSNFLQGKAAYPASRALYKAGQGPTSLVEPALLEALAFLMQQQSEPEP